MLQPSVRLDRYAVAAYQPGNDISWITVEGSVTGAREYSTVAGGMEIPCELTFLGNKRHVAKLKRVIDGLNSSFIYNC